MATWSEIYTLTGAVDIRGGVATDGDFIYYWDPATGIYRYRPDTNTDSLIISNASVSYVSGEADFISLQNFQGRVYIAVKHDQGSGAADNNCLIYRISGTTATLVHTFDTTLQNTGGGLFADDTTMVVVGMNSGTGDAFSKYTTDGSNWTLVTPPIWNTGTPTSIQTINGVSGQFGHDGRALGIFVVFDGASNYAYKFTGGQWVRQPDPMPSGSFLIETGPTYHVTRHDGQEFTTDFDTYTIPSFVDVYAACQLNMPWSIGHFDPDGTERIYKLEAGAWTQIDTAPGISHAAPTGGNLTNKAWYIRLDSGDAYALTRVSTTWYVWERSAAFDPPDEPMGGGDSPPCTNFAIFYYGIETPLVRGELPFCGVNPGALAVSAGGVALVGGNIVLDGEGLISSVVYAEFPYDDNDFIDMSGIVPLTTGVSSVKIV
jgi:hypothetical protein